ncbi:ABC transporter ATP-binding protein [Actinomyces vulturis]|uniref:ABC transporter ATP-binding protein n=1 Tax=Actinomyces vulturis TaxID=1857645 RepID=UPI001FDF1569|nr:ABC transporter ATP-binding protein [Actinomyces vulturis]
MVNDFAIECRNLYKAFGNKIAVNNLSMLVPVGSFFGVVGPNGAGKTTTLSMATGLLTPDHGQVLVRGIDLWAEPDKAHPILGILPDGLRTFDRLNGRELVTYCAMLRGMDKATISDRVDQLLKVLDLWDAGTTVVADYSAGMKKKINLACALVHSPDVLVLDEPFEAVDPISARVIQRLLRHFVEQGGTVILSSHVMATVEQLCSHVAIIHEGTVLAQGSLDEVRRGESLDDRFAHLVGAEMNDEELSWLKPSSR